MGTFTLRTAVLEYRIFYCKRCVLAEWATDDILDILDVAYPEYCHACGSKPECLWSHQKMASKVAMRLAHTRYHMRISSFKAVQQINFQLYSVFFSLTCINFSFCFCLVI